MTKIIAMHLPQYHCIPENDVWWGKGFTEWTNVKAANALYENHLQPRIPLGQNYYDLGEEETLYEQMRLAKTYGVDGFCFYHYWFNGKKLLEKPIEQLLKRKAELPYCLCWANEPWTRNWDGLTNAKEILMKQTYGEEKDWTEHYCYLKNYFVQDEYIKVNGKPVFVIYKASDITSRKEMFAYWNNLAQKDGFPGVHIVNVSRDIVNRNMPLVGNAVMDFEPFATLSRVRYTNFPEMISYHCGMNESNKNIQYAVIDYKKFCDYLVERYTFGNMNHYLGFFVGWDNTPRRGDNTEIIFANNEPDVFEKYFLIQMKKSMKLENDFLFINAWNEWGEGTFLEPDETYQYGYLKAIKTVKEKLG